MRPVICLITPSVQGAVDEALLLDRIGAATRAGVHLIQIRQPGMDGRALASLVRRAVAVAEDTGARVLVNDRVDVAMAAGAHGVHLRGNSVPAVRVRAVVPSGFLVGRSVHSAEEAARVATEGGLDYLIFGTVFETSSKPGVEPAGAARLADTCAAVTLPVLAVGGVTIPRLGEVRAAGAAGFAAIGLFSDHQAGDMSAIVREARAVFGTA